MMFARTLARTLAWWLWRNLHLVLLGAALAALLGGCGPAAPRRSVVVWVDVSASVPAALHAAWRRDWRDLVARGAFRPGDRVRVMALGARSHDVGAGVTIDVPRIDPVGTSWRRQESSAAAAREALVAAFDSMLARTPSPGTAIGAALRASGAVVAGDGSRIAAVVLFTDGVESRTLRDDLPLAAGLPPCVWMVGVGATLPPGPARRLQHAWWERLRDAGARVPTHHVATTLLGWDRCLEARDP